jgi:N-methylhydantoinase B/oxoprolinase/acetone carboxylase alpha subunit
VEINEEEGSAVLDFEGTGCEVRGNLNAPISVVHSAVIYCMRAMLNVDIPLNAGCLVPIESTFFGTNRQSNDYIDVNYCSQDSQKISSFPI